MWSAAFDFEGREDPNQEVVAAVEGLARMARERIRLTRVVRDRAAQIAQHGAAALDAIHLALAETAGCDALVTCDDRFVKRSARVQSAVRVVNPIEFVREMDHGQPA